MAPGRARLARAGISVPGILSMPPIERPRLAVRPRKLRRPGLESLESRQLLAVFTVNSLADSGAGTLRQAILDANNASGGDTIQFQIPGPGPFTIQPTSPLPTISDSVAIDGRTQPGFANTPIVELNGAGAGPTASGLVVAASNTTIQGLVINRFGQNGIEIDGVNGGAVVGNFLGTDTTGTVALGNGSAGLSLSGTRNILIGGTTALAANVISANGGNGIAILGSGAGPLGNIVTGNKIGTDLTGARSLPNNQNAIFLSSSGNQVGGIAPAQANIVAFNGGAGVRVGTFNFETGITSNTIRGNSIFGNAGLGIDLGNVGVNFNHFGPSNGPNQLLNFPVLNSAYPSTAGTQIEGSYDGLPNSTLSLDFYSNQSPDPSGYGQGQTYLGSTVVTTDSAGHSSFTASLPVAITAGISLSATATDAAGNTSEFARDITVTAAPQSDLNISVVDSPDPVRVGDQLTYSFTVRNDGPSRATNTQMVQALPAGATFVSASASQGTTAVSGSTLTASLGTLDLGQIATVSVVVRPTAIGTITTTANVRADQTNPFPNHGMTTVSTTVLAPIPADLSVTQFASPFVGTVAQDLTLTIVVTNYGPNNQATGVQLSDTLPQGATLISAIPSSGTVTIGGGKVNAVFGSLPFGGTATLQLVVRPTQPGILTNTATVSGDQPDPNALNNTSTLNVSINPSASADVALTGSALPAQPLVGKPLTYTFQAVNNGGGLASGVVVTVPLPEAATYVSSSSSQGSVAVADGVVTATLGNLIPGQAALVTITVIPTALGPIEATATVTADQPDFVPANNSVTVTATVGTDATPPRILAQRLQTTPNGIKAVVLSFSKALDPVLAGTLKNYQILNVSAHRSPVALKSVDYDPSTRTVTLRPKQPLHIGTLYQLVVNGTGAPGVTDRSGNVVDGDLNGLPDGIFDIAIGRGTSQRPVQFQRNQKIPIPSPRRPAKPQPKVARTPQGPRAGRPVVNVQINNQTVK